MKFVEEFRDRAMMAAELVHKGACEAGPAIHNYLPQKNHLPIWAGMAEAAAKDPECQASFLQLAREVDAEARLVQHVTDLQALATVASLPAADDRLLEEVAARCRAAGGRNQANLAELRPGSSWRYQNPGSPGRRK